MRNAPGGARHVAKAGPIGRVSTVGLRLMASWIWLQGQYVWVPRNVGPYWRPYTVGRWVFTDRYGWMWVSRRAVRLGHLSLRPLGLLEPGRLVLGAGQPLGARLGVMALVERLSRLGAAAADPRRGLEHQHHGRNCPRLLLAGRAEPGLPGSRSAAQDRARQGSLSTRSFATRRPLGNVTVVNNTVS